MLIQSLSISVGLRKLTNRAEGISLLKREGTKKNHLTRVFPELSHIQFSMFIFHLSFVKLVIGVDIGLIFFSCFQ